MGAILDGSTSLDHTACGRARRRPDNSLDMIFSRHGSSPNCLRYSAANRPICQKPHLLAMSVTNVLGSELINSFRTASYGAEPSDGSAPVNGRARQIPITLKPANNRPSDFINIISGKTSESIYFRNKGADILFDDVVAYPILCI